MSKELSPQNTVPVQIDDNSNKAFTNKILALGTLASGIKRMEDPDSDTLAFEKETRQALKALGATGSLQEMLATQMLAIHRLQQISMCLANETTARENRAYFTNTAIKLSNTFIQQASLLHKLQGNCAQKITVEHVDVHDGGQAVVGNIQGASDINKRG